MDAASILSLLRAGQPPNAEAMRWFAAGLGDGSVSDAQAGAFAMGVCRTPLSEAARIALTEAMRDSGTVLQWDLPGPVLDKHSTGGVGDCVSLLLAPALAACGGYVPMISGRGLGHTGGTLDKLEAIPGYSSDVSVETLRDVTARVGCAIVSASADIAPADKRLYAVRDVTGTVASLDLITASILSKKLAAGLDGLVLDVKLGTGAFMKGIDEARALAGALVGTASGAGCPTTALITDMNQPVVPVAGNALEVIAALDTLTGRAVSAPLRRITMELGAALLVSGGLALDIAEGRAQIARVLDGGAAAERFGAMVAALGGPTDFVERYADRLPAAPVVVDVWPRHAGFVTGIDAEALGQVVVALGGGRRVAGARINPAVGLVNLARIGDRCGQDHPLGRIHAASPAEAETAAEALRAAYVTASAPVDPPDLLIERVEA